MQPTSATALLNRLLARGKFRHVQVLLLLAELGSVQRTAEVVGLTQSSVTQSLAALEALLEVKLFERHARGVRPTAACVGLLPAARQMLLRVAESADVVLAHRQRGEGVVRMIGSAAAIHGVLVQALPAFADRHPRIQVQLREAEGEDQLLAVARGEVDVVVCRQPQAMPAGWEFHPLRQDRIAAVCRAAHPLAKVRKISPARLAKEVWLVLPAGSAVRAHHDEFAASLPEVPAIYPLVSYSLTMTWWLLRQRDLLLLVAVQLARPMLENGELVELPVPGLPAMRPLGILQPVVGMGEAAGVFSGFLRGFVREAPATSPH
ncbi:LysR family transcriptional regulator [Caenimonas sedimenti]|uniref:LysR family transcriptional regulator n=1 Tax=Caenimonas sedimenti TaxID=2596921 RepID=A0A562ZM79_9BURK|nr:LysR family transcriptional regulator [Caenimonas sedimenti]TWO69501.1 LysR family transcriptional regulator [Caenimonas sedimenti]